jgi:hypothetical protein
MWTRVSPWAFVRFLVAIVLDLVFPWKTPRGRRQAAPEAIGGLGTIPGSGNGGQCRPSQDLRSVRSALSPPFLAAGGHGILPVSRRQEMAESRRMLLSSRNVSCVVGRCGWPDPGSTVLVADVLPQHGLACGWLDELAGRTCRFALSRVGRR